VSKKRKPPSCDLCGEDDRKLKRVTVLVDRKKYMGWNACAPCRAVLMVLLANPKNHRNPH
jgi:hypothetical protein